MLQVISTTINIRKEIDMQTVPMIFEQVAVLNAGIENKNMH